MLIKEFIQVFRDPRMRVVIFVDPVRPGAGHRLRGHDRRAARAARPSTTSTTAPASRELVGPLRPARAISTWSSYVGQRRRRPASLLDRGDVARRAADQPRLRRRPARRPHRAGANDRRRHRLEHGRHRARATPRGSPAAYSRADRCVERIAAAHGAAPAAGPASTCRPAPGSTRTWKAAISSCPACSSIVVTLVTLLLTSMAVVREKEIGTMEQIMVTPITPRRVHPRQDGALRPDRLRRRDPRDADRRVLVRGADPRASCCCCFGARRST